MNLPIEMKKKALDPVDTSTFIQNLPSTNWCICTLCISVMEEYWQRGQCAIHSPPTGKRQNGVCGWAQAYIDLDSSLLLSNGLKRETQTYRSYERFDLNDKRHTATDNISIYGIYTEYRPLS